MRLDQLPTEAYAMNPPLHTQIHTRQSSESIWAGEHTVGGEHVLCMWGTQRAHRRPPTLSPYPALSVHLFHVAVLFRRHWLSSHLSSKWNKPKEINYRVVRTAGDNLPL